MKSVYCWALLVVLTGAPVTFAQQGDHVAVRPKEIADVLVNPGMGITTFQRFKGQELNPPVDVVGDVTIGEASARKDEA